MIPDLPGWDSLPAVTRYHNWAEMAGIIAVAILVVAEVIQFKYGHRRDDLSAQEQTATNQRHDEEMARLHLETATANEATETLRRQNLELEQAIAPRILNQAGPDKALKPFAGQIVQLDGIMEFEAQRLTGELASLFKSADWDLRPADPKLSLPFEGVTIEYFQRAGSAAPDPNQAQRVAAAKALAEELKKQNIQASLRPTVGTPTNQETLRASGMIIEAIRVTVGPKPTTYFLEQRYPWIKEQRERFEKAQEESNRREAAARERMNKALQEHGLPPLPPE